MLLLLLLLQFCPVWAVLAGATPISRMIFYAWCVALFGIIACTAGVCTDAQGADKELDRVKERAQGGVTFMCFLLSCSWCWLSPEVGAGFTLQSRLDALAGMHKKERLLFEVYFGIAWTLR